MKMRLKISIILLTTFLNCQLYSQVEIVLGTEKQSIYPFVLNEDSVQKDLKLLKSLFTSKQVIAIGESTHGSKEFFQAKSEIIKFLISSCGFKVISVEIDLISSLYINDYIKGRSGNLDSAMKIHGYWIYYTPEFKNLIIWLREFNANKNESEKVSFYGFDMQTVTNYVNFMKQYISERALLSKKEFINITDPVSQIIGNGLVEKIYTENKEHYFKLKAAAVKLLNWQNQYDSELKVNHTKETYELIKVATLAFDFATGLPNQAYGYRDSCMAQLFFDLMKINPEFKHILWAHNLHISTFDSIVKYDIYEKTMGNYINKRLNKGYYPIGTIFNKGSFLALDKSKHYKFLKIFSLPGIKGDSFSKTLSEKGHPNFFMDIEQTGNKFFYEYKKIYTLGATYNPKKPTNTLYMTPGFTFKGIIFINQVNHAEQIDNYYFKVK